METVEQVLFCRVKLCFAIERTYVELFRKINSGKINYIIGFLCMCLVVDLFTQIGCGLRGMPNMKLCS